MRYRSFGKLDWRPSALGFGAMRLPIVDGDSSKIVEAKAIKMIRYAIDQGVNYIDTAYPYHKGNSEIVVGKALKDGYRKKVKLATKLPVWLVEEGKDFDKFLDEQLKKLKVNHIDFYLFHGLDRQRWEKICKLDIFSWAEKALSDGRIGYLGFSFHDSYKVFQKIIDDYNKWTFCQIQYNFLDVDFQAGKRGLKYAASKGLAVVVMEPLKGGKLAELPQAIQKMWQKAKAKRTPVDWALQWVWNQPRISLLLSGMSTLQQVKENVQSANLSAVNSLKPEELSLIDQIREKYEKLVPISCTQCKYCLPCPQGINIPRILDIYNNAKFFGRLKKAKSSYQSLDKKASSCVQCGQCEKLCPQKIEIRKWLKKADALLSSPDQL
ncbi:MAG TPA: aldo/keto reductase [Nevskiaceae bacterium]|nr:aldo/keto reductase [Nevskiaceae bacterium]